MVSQAMVAAILLLLFLALIAATTFLHRHRHWSTENSRKFIHVAGGVLCLAGFSFIKSTVYVVALCSVAFVVLSISFFAKKLPAIHRTARSSFGSILFPIPICVCYLASKTWEDPIFFFLPVSLLTFSDTLAEWGGNKWKHRSRHFFAGQKTLAGSLCFAVSALLISICLFVGLTDHPVWSVALYCTLIALAATLAEALTLKGFDNLSVPLVALVLLRLMT